MDFAEMLEEMWQAANSKEEAGIMEAIVDFVKDKTGGRHTAHAFHDDDDVRDYATSNLGMTE